jgi:hypothetical protein
VFNIERFEILRDSHFIVYLGGTCLRDTDLKGEKKACSSNGMAFSAKDQLEPNKRVQDILEDVLKITTEPNGRGRAESEFGDDLVSRLEHLAYPHWIKPFCLVVGDTLFLNVLLHGKLFEAVSLGSASETTACHDRGGQQSPVVSM